MEAAGIGFIVLLALGGLILCGLLALIVGIVALVRIKSSGGKLRGRGLAIAAIVIGLLLALGIPVFGVVGAGFMWFAAGDAARPMPPRAERSYSSDEGHSSVPPAMEAEIRKRLRPDEIIIKSDVTTKAPPAYGEKKVDIFRNPAGQPDGKAKR